MTAFRLPPQPGEWIDRGRALQFQFEGRSYSAFAGDTISSALAANGVRMLGRSFKYHRPRGIYSLSNHDVNALMAGDGRTNIRADVTPIWEGANLTAVNTFGGLERDRVKFIDHFGRFLPVGFYYKTFFRPRGLFPFWERQMRAMAGLGSIDAACEHRRTPKDYSWCEVLVVGAGPAGLSAAAAAAEQGLRVLLVDEHPRPGGSLLYQWAGEPATRQILASLLDRVGALANLELRTSTLAAGYYADHWVPLVSERNMTKVRAQSVVLAAGAFEQPALFRNNDLPGVMLASAAVRLMHLYAVKPFARGVVLAANADGYRAALDLVQAGVGVAAIVDLRPQGETSELGARAAQAKIPIYLGQTVYEAIALRDKTGIRGVTLCHAEGLGQQPPVPGPTTECDGLAMSVGWAPADSLFCQAGGKMTYCRQLEQFVPGKFPSGVFTTGRLNGIYDLECQLADGRRAGLAAAAHLGRYSGPLPEMGNQGSAHAANAAPPSHPYPVVKHPAGKVFIDLDEDVQLKDIENAAQEGFDSIELLKRYSTFGMGPSQGKIANTNTIRVLAKLRGTSVGETGSPTARPFFHPVPLGHLAGRGFHPRRRTPLHGRHQAAGARFMPAGDWLRPAYYAAGMSAAEAADPDVREQVTAAEVRAVREGVGLIDVGTLGKIEINGPDAAEFIERIYTGRFAKMKIGATRYGLMCDESGVVIDDGVVGRLAEDRFYVTTTTTASGSVYREMQRWAIVWGLGVVLANVTGSIAAINLAGPRARQIMGELSDVNVREESFPYLGLREGHVLGVPARLLRTGFVGEVGYEVHVPAHQAVRVWDGLMQAGSPYAIRPFGVEAQRVLRLEKGHVIVSQDTDGLTTPLEAGLGWAIKADKPFFVGGRSLAILATRPLKRRLVGFALPRGYAGPVPLECHLVIDKGEIMGRVTSISRSAALGRVIGLAYVHPRQAALGAVFQIRAAGGTLVPATVVETPFYDPQNRRQSFADVPKIQTQVPYAVSPMG